MKKENQKNHSSRKLIEMLAGSYTTEFPAAKITISEASKTLDLSRLTVNRLIKSGLLKTTKGGHITLGYLVEYLNSSDEKKNI